MKRIVLSLFLAVVAFGCAKEEPSEETVKYIGCMKNVEKNGTCSRWMDRKIYFAYSSVNNAERNNEFQKAKIQDALREIEIESNLGENYFQFQEADEAVLSPIIESGKSENEYRSFILIWPDIDFNNFIVNALGGQVPDQNAVTIINAAYKKKFFMIIKASCLVTSSNCNNITTAGLKSLVARQLGFLVGIPPKNCSLTPEDVMCAEIPQDSQWNDLNKNRWVNSFNNMLETILNNPNYYDEIIP